MAKELRFNYDNRKIERQFTKEWGNSGFINMDKIPDIVRALVDQRNSMMEYIEALHDKIDKLIIDNNICDCPSCHKAGCTSDHK
jgi:DNA-dependent RNA polymerase auxiliary subunit epsilon